MMSPSDSVVPLFLRRALGLQRRNAGGSTLIVLTLAMALGANSSMLTVADALVLKAVPFNSPERLVAVTSAFPSIKLTAMNLSGPEALEFQQLTRTFSASGPFAFTGVVVQSASEAELANGVRVSQGAAAALGVVPFAGRAFTDSDYAGEGSPVAMLGHGLWQRAFGGDARIVGTVVQLGGESREIVGVLPPGLAILNRPVDVWLPLALSVSREGGRSDHGYHVVARIAPGVSFADAAADVRRSVDVWREETGELHVPTATMHPVAIEPLTQATTGLSRAPVGALVGAVGFVLLIACANVSNLLVARAEARRSEFGLQLALGATHSRLIRESLVEGLLLATTGCAAGLAMSHVILGALRSAWPALANVDLALDYRVLGAMALVTAGTGLLIGVLPALRWRTASAHDLLRSGARGSVGSGRRQLQTVLVAVQLSLAVVLACCAGLMVQSLQALASLDSGIEPAGVTRAQVSLASGSYPEDEHVWSFYDRVLEQLRGTPGVTRAAVMSGLPPLRRANNTSFLLDGVEAMDHSSFRQVEFVQHVSPDYFSTLSVRLIEGRLITSADHDRSAPVAVVNETLARQFWPNASAIGHRLKPAGDIGTWFTVVGIVSDVRQAGLKNAAGSEVYVGHRQARLMMNGFMPRGMNVVVSADASADAMASAIRSAVRTVDPGAAVSGIAPMQSVIDRTIAEPRLLAWMFSAFAMLALLVAAIGVYAVTSSAVGTRTAEFGVRIALGARPVDVLALVLRGGLLTIAAGLTAGILASIFAARLMARLLFATAPLDPISLLAGGLAMGAAALIATLLPAGRAARVDPLTALRD